MNADYFLNSTLFELQKMKHRADRALDQVTAEDLFRKLSPDSNSLAEILKHVGGNLRSRWTDFLSSDGEKSGRNRDSEFKVAATDTPENIRQNWNNGWDCLLAALRSLRPEDVERTVPIRGEQHTVVQAIHRTLTHSANHVGQIIYLAKYFAGPRWKYLTVPRGQSEQYTSEMLQGSGGGYLSKL